MITDAKKQHYVPQFYLENFSNASKNGFYIFCFDKERNTSYINNIKQIAQENKFYETEEVSIEKGLGKLEEVASRHINKIIQHEKYKLLNDKQLRFDLSEYIITQYVRTKAMRIKIEEFFEKIPNKEEQMTEFPYSAQFKTTKDEAKFGHIALTSDQDRYLQSQIAMKKWILIKNKTELNFCTSDNPIVIFNKNGTSYLNRPESHIFIPITPKLCLCFANPEYFVNFNTPKRSYGIKSILNNIENATMYKMTKENEVKCINNLQYKFSTRHVFSKEDDFKELI